MSLRWRRACRLRKRVVAELGGDGWVKCPACWASWAARWTGGKCSANGR
ncbi:hypothetical protein OG585_08225 [Streptomyces sp. NBC_01340]|nr:hypothetical protein OG585_08225 [Streptomyces sp. NBC_01340]